MSKLKRLGKASMSELGVRGAQATAAFAERRGWLSLAKLPTDQTFLKLLDQKLSSHGFANAGNLLEHFRTRNGPNFFAGFASPAASIAALRSHWPNTEAQIIARANRILAGKFDLLGLRDLSFGDPIDWQLEPVSGKRAPHVHWSRLNYLDPEVTGDKKIVWELNRHQHFTTLGQAWWLTADERYAQAFAAHLDSWMDQNPPKLGINWTSSLEVAFRAISWLWAFHFFKHSEALTEQLFLRALKFLYLNARHLETYLSTYFSPNTHLTGEALALFYLGTLLPEISGSERWRKVGRQILLQELSRQVRPDGVYFEQATSYHRYTTDFYIHFLILARANGEVLPAEVDQKLMLLLNHLMYITRPDGTTPLIGDDDGGRLVMLEQRPAGDFRATLATGAALFQRGDYRYVAEHAAAETLWLLGAPGLADFDRVSPHEPDQQSLAFHDGGYYVMRDGWARDSNYLMLDCGPHGVDNCGHAHADALAFNLAARGRTLLVDPGTYTYTGSQELRDWFRSSPAHNTLTVDGESSSQPAGPFSWKSITAGATQAWISRTRFDYFEGLHAGYQRLAAPVAHSRAVLFLKNDYWLMRDRVQSDEKHRYDLWFHFEVGATPGLQFADDSGASLREMAGAAGLEISSFGQNASWRREEQAVSHCYGERESAPVFVFSATIGSGDLVTFLVPRANGEPAASVCEIAATGGRAFEVLAESSYDLVMIKAVGQTGEPVETGRLESDFDWTWARFAHEGATVPDELILLGGQRLKLDGKEVLHYDSRVEFVVASREGEQIVISNQ